MKKHKRKIAILLTFIAMLFATVTIFIAFHPPAVTFSESLRFPVGTRVTLSDVIVNVEFGKLTEPNKVLDSSKQGLVKVTFSLQNLLTIESEREIMLEFYLPESEENKTAEQEEITTAEPGETVPTETKEPVTELPSPFGENGTLIDGSYRTKNGNTLIVQDGIASVEGIMLINKSYPLPKKYDPGDLTPETKEAYDELLDAAVEANISLKVDNGYRSYTVQKTLFNGYVRKDSLENALTYSARPGHSEHQSGYALDLLLSDSEEAKMPENKRILDWLNDNAYRYGFILRYPEGKSQVTGYIFEPWHYRYVGTELAEILYNDGNWITLEEYFGVDSIYRGYN